MRRQSNKGFTLLELLVITSIISILLVLGLPLFHDYVKRSHVFEGMQLSSAAKFSVYEFYYWNNRFPYSNAEADLPSPETINGNSLKSLTISNGTITLTYNEKVEDNATILMKPTINSGNITWDCTEGSVKWHLRPKNCRAN